MKIHFSLKIKLKRLWIFILIIISAALGLLSEDANIKSDPIKKDVIHRISSDNFVHKVYNWTWDYSESDVGYCITQDLDGNFYIGGYTVVPWDKQDWVLIKFNNKCEYQWHQTWGFNGVDMCRDIVVDSLGSIYMAGVIEDTNFMRSDACLVKFDSSGNYLWHYEWINSYCNGMIIDPSDYIILTINDYFNGDIQLLNYSNSGDLQWSSRWGTSNLDWVRNIALDQYQNIYITGSIYKIGEEEGIELFFVEFNNRGQFLGYQTWGGKDTDSGYSILVDSEVNIYISGITSSYGTGADDICLLKYSSSLELIWERTWGNEENNRGNAIGLDPSGNVYVIGTSEYETQDDICLLKYNKKGVFTGYFIWGDTGDQSGQDLILINSTCLIALGTTKGDICLLKFELQENYQSHDLYNPWYSIFILIFFLGLTSTIITISFIRRIYNNHNK